LQGFVKEIFRTFAKTINKPLPMNRFFTIFLTLILFCSFKNTQAQIVLPKGAIPIVYRHDGIYIPAKINDSIEGNFMFDTGADRVLLLDHTFYNDHAFLRNLNLGYRSIRGVGTEGGQNVPAIIDTLDFSFGTHVYRSAPNLIANWKQSIGDIVDGIVGHRYFSENKYLMEINYVDEYMILHRDASTIDLSDYTKISMKKQGTDPNIKFYVPVRVQVNDTLVIEDYFLFDTGAANLAIATFVAEKYNLPALNTDKLRVVMRQGGASGRSTKVFFRGNSIEIGGYKLDDVAHLIYSEDQSGAMASARVGYGLLGNRILQHFDMVIDFGDDLALYLKPNRNFNTPFEDIAIHRGFGLVDRSQTLNGWIVTSFFEGTPAEKSGMQVGDKIIFANGISIFDIPFEKQFNFWKNLDRTELIVLRNNEELKFEFELNVAK